MGGFIQMNKKRRVPILTDDQIILAIFHELRNRTEKEETEGKTHTSRSLWKYLIDLREEKDRNLTFREVLLRERRERREKLQNDC